jgi:hypothetical protein
MQWFALSQEKQFQRGGILRRPKAKSDGFCSFGSLGFLGYGGKCA